MDRFATSAMDLVVVLSGESKAAAREFLDALAQSDRHMANRHHARDGEQVVSRSEATGTTWDRSCSRYGDPEGAESSTPDRQSPVVLPKDFQG